MNSDVKDGFTNDLIRASAGTGKTYRLSNRYLQLLASGVSCESILATTFTRKGAGEILDRIIQRLANAALDSTAAAELERAIGMAIDSSRAQQMLGDLMTNLHRLQIGTLDGFFSRIAKSFSYELELPTDWSIVQEQQMDLLRDQAIQEVLREDSVLQLVRLMNKGEAQRRVAELIRLTVRRLYGIYLDSEPDAWDQIPACDTYLSESVLDEIVLELQSLETCEFPDKRQAKKMLDESQLVAKRDWDALIQSTMFASVVAGDPRYYKPLSEELISIYERLLSHCRAYVVTRLIRQNRSTYQLLEKYAQRFERLKTVEGQLRFDDITQRLVGCLADRQTHDLAFRLDQHIEHLLLDEFQDTSPAQWSVIRPFAERATQQIADRSFFYVGDMKQAIFGWRGGVAEIFDVVTDELDNIHEPEPLKKSWRSSPVIINMVNRVFGGLDQISFKKSFVENGVLAWQQRFEAHETAKQDLPGYVRVEFAPEATDAEGRTEKGRKRNEQVIQRTVELVSEISQQHADDDDFSIGVLVRKNETVGEVIFGLQQAGISASEEGGNPLTDSAAVELVLSALQLVDHPSDSLARFHLSHSPLASWFELLPELPDNQELNIQAAQISCSAVRGQLLTDGYGPTIEAMAADLASRCTEREMNRLQQLVQQAFNYDQQVRGERSRLRADRFVSYIRNEFRAHDRSSAKIRVMTIHQSKGLEFDIVVLPQKSGQGWLSHHSDVVVDRKSPTDPVSIACRWVGEKERGFIPESVSEIFDRDREREVRESLSVLYVALTRAAHSTYVILSRGAKSTDVSDSGILLSRLADGISRDSEESLIFEDGKASWYQAPRKEEEPVADPSGESFYIGSDERMPSVSLKPGIHSGRGLPKTNPSSLEGGNHVRLRDVFSIFDKRDALNYGELIHRCFQNVSWLENHAIDLQLLAKQLDGASFCKSKLEKGVKDFEKMIGTDAVSQLVTYSRYRQEVLPAMVPNASELSDSLRLEVQNERSFAVLLSGKMMQGVIDRLVLIYNEEGLIAADLIDFKSEIVSSENIQEKVEYYRPQLTAYRLAVSLFTGLSLERISARLLFVSCNVSVDIETDEEEDDLLRSKIAESANLMDSMKSIQAESSAKSLDVNFVSGSPKNPKADQSRDGHDPISEDGQLRFWDD